MNSGNAKAREKNTDSVPRALPAIPELNSESIQKKRRGGAVPWAGSLAAASGLTAGKAAVLLAIFTGIGIAGAITNHFVSKDLAAQRARQAAADKARAAMLASARHAFASGDVSNLPTDRSASGDSLSMFNDANRGGTGDAAATGAPAPENPADSAGGAGNSDSKNNAQADAANGAGSAANGQGSHGSGQNSNAFGGARIGQLSTGGGAGGVHGLSGGPGMSGGLGRGFDPTGGAGAGELSAMARPVNPAIGKTAASRPVTVAKGGANLVRLGTMNSAMKPTASMGDAQRASQIQSDQWSSGQAAPGGQSIMGAGDSLGGMSSGDNGDAPSVNSGPSMSPHGAGGSYQSAPAITNTRNVTPWQGMLNTAQMLLMAAAAFVIAAGALNLMFKTGWIHGHYVAKILAGIAAAMATAALAIGGIIMTQYGQYAQGMVLMLGGISVLAAAAYAMIGPGSAIKNIWVILGGALGFGSAFMAKMTQHRTSSSQ